MKFSEGLDKNAGDHLLVVAVVTCLSEQYNPSLLML